jgi:pyridoxal phosphate enzyme (YggS family)
MGAATADDAEPGDIAGRVAAVRRRIVDAARAAGRDPAEVRLLAATKTVEPTRIIEALAAGVDLIAENRVQEVVAKAAALAGRPHTAHFIGHLQANKVNALLGLVSCIQTVDSAGLAGRLSRRVVATGSDLEVFVQVNVSGEDTKSGVSPSGAAALVDAVTDAPGLRLRGYMTIGLNSPDPGAVRAGFATLRELRDRLGVPGADELSMGMTGDYLAAIAEGATIVRLGSAIFGARPGLTGHR